LYAPFIEGPFKVRFKEALKMRTQTHIRIVGWEQDQYELSSRDDLRESNFLKEKVLPRLPVQEAEDQEERSKLVYTHQSNREGTPGPVHS
jgi:hypothetical protein